MPQIFDVTANENARYKRNELEFLLYIFPYGKMLMFGLIFSLVWIL